MIEGNPQQLLEEAKKAEEQKAWDTFAAAALTGIISSEFGHRRMFEHYGDKPASEIFSLLAAKHADAMMKQRKARM